MTNIVCSGPGPHIPSSGILGTTDAAVAPSGMICSSPSCVPAQPVNAVNASTIQTRLLNGLSVLENDVIVLTGASPTQAQKDAALLHCVRAAARLTRLALAQFDASGA